MITVKDNNLRKIEGFKYLDRRSCMLVKDGSNDRNGISPEKPSCSMEERFFLLKSPEEDDVSRVR